MSLQNNQRAAVSRMINLNSDIAASGQKGSTWSDKWKVLIYDLPSRSTIAPLLSVQDLRQLGITVFMMADARREKIPDVPAVYFLQPTPENVQIVANDCNQGLYQAAHVNFSSTLPRTLLERLAEETSKGGGSQRISRLMDQYLDFVALEPCLFTLERPLTYFTYTKANVSDQEAKSCMQGIVDGLYSVIVTLGMIPIIRAPANGIAEEVAKLLDDKLRKSMRNSKTQHLFQQDDSRGVSGSSGGRISGVGGVGGSSSSSSSGGGGSSGDAGGSGEGVLRERPVLVLLDRSIDLGQVMHHTSLYQPLVDDLLEFKLNRVTYKKKIGSSSPANNGSSAAAAANHQETASFTLDPNVDYFWNEFGGQLFPNAVEGNEKDRARLAKEEQEISSSGQTGDMQYLASAVASLERHTEHKKRMNDHLNLLEATMNVIVARSLPEFYEYEESIVSGAYTQQSEQEKYFNLLINPQKGTYNDKLRLAVVWIQADCSMQSERPNVYQKILMVLDEAALNEKKSNDIHQVIFNHVQQIHQMSLSKKNGYGGSSSGNVNANGKSGTDGSSSGSGWSLSGLTKTMGAVVAKAKEWIPRAAPDTKITQVAGNIMAGKESTLLYFDSKIGSRSGISLPHESRRKGTFNAGIVFVIGGATYTEYHNMKEWAKKQQPQKSVIVGSTSMLNAETFIDELSRMSPTYSTGAMD